MCLKIKIQNSDYESNKALQCLEKATRFIYLTKNIFFVSSEVDKTHKIEFEFHVWNSISDLGDGSVTAVVILGGFQCPC
jgi:hypothetical protein